MKRVLIMAFILASLLLTMVVPTASALSDTGIVYSDISGKWFTDAATKFGYPEIFSDGSQKFSPGKEVTRIEFIRLLHQALGININYFVAPDIKDYFDDMKNTDSGADELIDLATLGIVESNENFDPNTPIEREVMIHWVMNSLNYETGGNYSMPMIMPAPFSDDTEISDTYRSEIYTSAVLQLVKGRGNNMLFPKERATRAEAVTIVSNLMALLDSYQSTVQVTTSASLAQDGSLAMTLTIQNHTDIEVSIKHMSGQQFDFKLFDAKGNNLYTWSADKMFMMLVNETKIKPGEEIVFSDTLNSETYHAMKQAISMKAYIVGTSDEFKVDINGYDTNIQ